MYKIGCLETQGLGGGSAVKGDLKTLASWDERTLVVNIQFGFASPRIYHIIKTNLAADDSTKPFVYVTLH